MAFATMAPDPLELADLWNNSYRVAYRHESTTARYGASWG